MNDFIVLLIILIFLAIILWLLFRNKKGKITIYGSMGCPYTVKQRDKYPGADFVDCTSTGCPPFVTAYPTTKFEDGSIIVGY
jgi:hypothetical protein